jgi:hypothetical protein
MIIALICAVVACVAILLLQRNKNANVSWFTFFALAAAIFLFSCVMKA